MAMDILIGFQERSPLKNSILHNASAISPVKTRIYNLSSGPHITRFSAVVAKKRKNFE